MVAGTIIVAITTPMAERITAGVPMEDLDLELPEAMFLVAVPNPPGTPKEAALRVESDLKFNAAVVARAADHASALDLVQEAEDSVEVNKKSKR